MKVSDLNEAIEDYSIPKNLSPKRREMYQTWIDWYKTGEVTKQEFNQFQESCKYKREVFTVDNMPKDMLSALEKSEMDPRHNHLNELLEHSEEHKDDRIVQKKFDFFGLPVFVEIVSGGIKYSKSYDGTPWQREMKCDYGYFDGITSGDGEYLDCYIGSEVDNSNNKVFVIKQMRPDGKEFDESKAMIGFPSKEEAKDMYMKHCHSDLCFGDITEYTIDDFRKTVKPND